MKIGEEQRRREGSPSGRRGDGGLGPGSDSHRARRGDAFGGREGEGDHNPE